MRFIASTILMLNSSLVGASAPQTTHVKELQRYFVEPQEAALTVVASQPLCDLDFSRALVLRGVEGGVAWVYQVRNHGNRAIRSYQVATVTSVGTGTRWSYRAESETDQLMPGEFRPKSLEDYGIKLIPITEDLRGKYDLRGPPKGVIVFLVLNVEYSDGTKFDGNGDFRAVEQFFDKSRLGSK